MKPLHALILATGIFTSTALLAHGDGQAQSAKGPNGGQLHQAGVYDYELVVAKDSREVKENPVMVYVTVHDKDKVSTAGATGNATILAGKLKAISTLKPDGDNRMKGFAKYASAADMKVVVSITLNGKAAEQTRFTPLARSGQ
ncbi:MAG: hypothetical protein M0Q22_14240 [Sulfuritalea sp.]|nr:hypothetical protein [Sulfuritalea sp.]